MTKTLARMAMVVLLLLGAVSSQADVIYDNGGPSGFIVPTSNYEITLLDDLELETGASSITDFHWYGAYYEDVPAEDDFTLYIFDENFNLVTEIDGSATTRDATGDTVDFPIVGGDFDEYYYELFVDPINLTAGSTYYLGIANTNDALWAWEATDEDILDGFAYWNQDEDEFENVGIGNFSFELTGPGATGIVPEPASMTLLGLGLVVVAARKKFSRS